MRLDYDGETTRGVDLVNKLFIEGQKVEEPLDRNDLESAIEALGNFDDKRSINYLVKSLNDKDKDIRKTAADALDKLGWEPE